MKLKYNEGTPAWFEGNTFVKYASISDLKKYWGLIPSDYGTRNEYNKEEGYVVKDYYHPVQEDWHLYFNQSMFFWKNKDGEIERYLHPSEIKSMVDPDKKVQKTRKKK